MLYYVFIFIIFLLLFTHKIGTEYNRKNVVQFTTDNYVIFIDKLLCRIQWIKPPAVSESICVRYESYDHNGFNDLVWLISNTKSTDDPRIFSKKIDSIISGLSKQKRPAQQ